MTTDPNRAVHSAIVAATPAFARICCAVDREQVSHRRSTDPGEAAIERRRKLAEKQ